jgi:hypothetical protein
VIPFTSQAIDAGSDQEMSSDLLARAEQLIDIALAIADMDASPWIAQKCRGLPEIFQPPNCFLLFDRNACRVDLPLERGGSFRTCHESRT